MGSCPDNHCDWVPVIYLIQDLDEIFSRDVQQKYLLFLSHCEPIFHLVNWRYWTRNWCRSSLAQWSLIRRPVGLWTLWTKNLEAIRKTLLLSTTSIEYVMFTHDQRNDCQGDYDSISVNDQNDTTTSSIQMSPKYTSWSALPISITVATVATVGMWWVWTRLIRKKVMPTVYVANWAKLDSVGCL
jgi:hypothetical protein